MTLRPIKILPLAFMASLWFTTIPTAYAQAPGGAELEVAPIEDGSEKAAETPTEAVKESAKALANPAEENPGGTAADIYGAIKAGKWIVVFGGVLLFAVWGLRLALVSWIKIKWLSTKRGGQTLAFGTSFGLSIGTAALVGQAPSVDLIMGAAGIAWGAAGVWGHLKDEADERKMKKAAA